MPAGTASRAVPTGRRTDEADLDAFKERCQDDRHHFRFIVSPEDSAELDDLRTYTRHLMNRMEADLGTRLDWVAVDHWNTDNPHTHLIVRGRDDTGKDLIIAGDYIAHGFRHRAAELATEWLGPRTELEIQQTRSVDHVVAARGRRGPVQIERFNEPRLQRQRLLLIGRLQHLQRLGLADEVQPGTWAVHADAEKTLRALGERGDIIRTMQRAMSGKPRELAVFEPGDDGRTIVGRVAAKGLADELRPRLSGHRRVGRQSPLRRVGRPRRAGELSHRRGGGGTRFRRGAGGRQEHRHAGEQWPVPHRSPPGDRGGRAKPGRDPQEAVAAHIAGWKPTAAGIVERVAEGLWKVPDDLAERGRQYDAQRLGGVAVELKSHLPIERQARVIGATWLDQQLIGGGKGLGDLGFGGDARQAAARRLPRRTGAGPAARAAADSLGICWKRCAIGSWRRPPSTLPPIADWSIGTSQTAARSRHLPALGHARQRSALLDDGMGFSLVPWRPIIEPRLGQQIAAATVRGGGVSWGRLDGKEVLGLDRGRRLSYRVKVSSSVLALASVLR